MKTDAFLKKELVDSGCECMCDLFDRKNICQKFLLDMVFQHIEIQPRKMVDIIYHHYIFMFEINCDS